VAETVTTRVQAAVLLASILVVAACAILYQLLIGTASSFFLGDTVRQFSLTIGVFLSSIGLGSFLSRFVTDRLLERFILVELLLGLFGAESVPLLFLAYAIDPDHYVFVMLAMTVLIGSLIGLELPLLTRIFERRTASLRVTLANVMSIDYLGALAAALMFPFVLLPLLGVFRGALVVGIVNLTVGVVNLAVVRGILPRWVRWKLGLVAAAVATVTIGQLILAGTLESKLHSALYDYPIVFDMQSKYQRVVVTRQDDDVRLYLDGALQFSSRDENRYHEALVHPAMSAARNRERVLVIGGGDGLAVRELLAYDDVREIVLVDIDPAMTDLGQDYPLLTGLNRNALNHAKVKIMNEDAFREVLDGDERFGVVISDLPDPKSVPLSRMYTVTFYQGVRKIMPASGVLVVQSSSPYFARRVFWCIEKTLAAAGFGTYPYHVWIPSFEAWGFVMATPKRTEDGTREGGVELPQVDVSTLSVQVKTQFLTDAVLRGMFDFPKDMALESVKLPIDVNRLDHHPIVGYHAESWRR
jgi:spermidine synthase